MEHPERNGNAIISTASYHVHKQFDPLYRAVLVSLVTSVESPLT